MERLTEKPLTAVTTCFIDMFREEKKE